MSSLMYNTLITICFVAGKSGGHLLPCITQAKQIKSHNPKSELYIFSTGNELDKKIINKHTYINHYIPATLWDVPYQQMWLLPLFCINVGWYFTKSLYKLWQLQPHKVISFGGFNSIPVCLAAKLLGIPFELYELNVEPGKATKFLSYFTNTIYTCFNQTKQYFPKHNCVAFNYPVRFSNTDKIQEKSTLLKKYNFKPNRTTILILGGSQGSTFLNKIFKEYIEQNSEARNTMQIIHQTGDSDFKNYANFYQNYNIPAIVFGYHERLQDFYNIADVIISRAGAGTLFEIKFFDKPCICIPHETANTNHQVKNVLALQEEYPHQFSIIKQADCSVAILKEKIQNFT
ncbi:MAG: hypothetical protein CL947_03105 [Epsilonproteobacteria bacterium]|nr:hypothetical protein [Campylobacterota bacterium]